MVPCFNALAFSSSPHRLANRAFIGFLDPLLQDLFSIPSSAEFEYELFDNALLFLVERPDLPFQALQALPKKNQRNSRRAICREGNWNVHGTRRRYTSYETNDCNSVANESSRPPIHVRGFAEKVR